MTVTNSLRPGVFSSYTITPSAAARASAQYAAVCARAVGGEAGTVYRLTSAGETAIFTGGVLPLAARLLLENGVSKVLCVPVGEAPDDEAYARAFAAVAELPNLGAVLCDSVKPAVQSALRESVEAASAALRERIGIVSGDTAENAAALALALNSERMCLCYPASVYQGESDAFFTACAFAAALLAAPAGENLNGSACGGIAVAGENLAESAVQTLLGAGVAVFEEAGGAAECIKAVTTRTKSGGGSDYSLANVSTIRIIDQILQRGRAMLKVLLKNARNNAATAQSIAAQMTVLLSAAADEGLVSGFDAPRVYPLADDPSVLAVELSFAAATALSQIHIVAHVQL